MDTIQPTRIVMKEGNHINRYPAVAGRFYPAEKGKLADDVNNLFRSCNTKASNGTVRAIIAPHAGYIYSGRTAAEAYSRIRTGNEYDNIFIIAASHTTSFPGASLYAGGDYIMPSGLVEVNRIICNKLLKGNKLFTGDHTPHYDEHSIEVQIPFLINRIKPGFKIVPLIIGNEGRESLERISASLSQYFTKRNLFVISSDFSHYPEYENAMAVDHEAKEAILSCQCDKLYRHLEKYGQSTIEGLVTPICGWRAIVVLLHLLDLKPGIVISHTHYSNSGDATHGDKTRVVGYHGFVAEDEKKYDYEDQHE